VATRIDAARTAAAGGDADLAAVELGRVVTDLVSGERMAEAMTVLRQAVTIVPSDAALRERLCASLLRGGDADATAGRLDTALAAYEEAVGVSPDSRDARVRLVRLLAQTGARERASEHLDRLGGLDEPDLRGQIELWLRNRRVVDARTRQRTARSGTHRRRRARGTQARSMSTAVTWPGLSASCWPMRPGCRRSHEPPTG
jgi:protein involved in temperature-dependent protein secretion